ncbi:hypothetical protein GGI42DRAFT_357786 [Trichoderma sp. SZMC 28013]
MENSNVDDIMGPGQDFNMDGYFYLDEEPNFTTISQEGPLNPQFRFTEYLASAIMPQEDPLDPFFNFNQEPSSTIVSQEGPVATHATLGEEPSPNVTSQESFTPPADYRSFMEGIMGMNVDFDTYIVQGDMPAPMPAPDTFQPRDVLLSPPVGQGDASTTPPAQATNQAIGQTTPATPPAEAPKQRNNPGPRGYKRSGKACTRCRKNKLRCDDNPQGCSNCAATGCTCMASTASGQVPRMHAHNTDNLVQVLHRHMEALEAYIQAQGGHVPERPDELKHW